MKRKTGIALCTAACMGILFGCGQKETMSRLEEAAETMADTEDNRHVSDSPNQIAEQEKGAAQEIMTSTISEYLGNGQKILYRIARLDKELSPEYIYFFEDGKVTCLDGYELGLTIGDLSRMTDDDIWEKMEECCENKYNILSDALLELKENKLKAGITYMELKENEQDIDEFAKEILMQMYMQGSAVALPAYSTADDTMPEYWEEWADSFPGGQEEITKTGEEVCLKMESYMPEIMNLSRSIPVAFIVETDATGNNVEDEGVVWMEMDGKAFKKIIIERTSMTGTIYDSDYVCYPADDNDIICVRDDTEMVFDDTGNNKVYVDIPISFSDVQELFQ